MLVTLGAGSKSECHACLIIIVMTSAFKVNSIVHFFFSVSVCNGNHVLFIWIVTSARHIVYFFIRVILWCPHRLSANGMFVEWGQPEIIIYDGPNSSTLPGFVSDVLSTWKGFCVILAVRALYYRNCMNSVLNFVCETMLMQLCILWVPTFPMSELFQYQVVSHSLCNGRRCIIFMFFYSADKGTSFCWHLLCCRYPDFIEVNGCYWITETQVHCLLPWRWN